jgi:Fur family ferric uptake transcriptional regulator
VATALRSFDDFRSAQDIHDLLRRSGDNVGLSTVYRTLQALADGGEVTEPLGDATKLDVDRRVRSHGAHVGGLPHRLPPETVVVERQRNLTKIAGQCP